ncbi:MAG TPA: SGNH/GDSL hydrolase family protein [Sphingobium sp.]|uniref:SGNH/GDSL hydrolase family protein n=1 Tax=Sphingobium sp. TaxID=1912891 RepID=UPI002ED25F45
MSVLELLATSRAAKAQKLAAPLGTDAFAASGGIISPTALKRWRRALGRMRTAEGYRPLVVMVGDSKTAGVGTDPTGQFRAATAISTRIAQILTLRGASAIAESMWGDAGTSSVPASLYDPRRSGFIGWAQEGGVGADGGIGGTMSSTSGTNPGIFTPSIPVDRVRVFYKQGVNNANTATATVTVDADATVRGSLLGGAAPVYARSPVIDLGSLASHAIKINPAGGSPFVLAGMIAWNSAVIGVDIANIAVSGVKASWQTTTTRLKWLEALAPDLTIINIGSNDMLSTGSTDVAAFTASVQATITRAKIGGDVVLIWPAIGRNAASAVPNVLVTDAQRAPFRAAIIALAVANDCVFVDEQALFGGRDVAHTDGVFVDDLHENGWATNVRANNLASILLS